MSIRTAAGAGGDLRRVALELAQEHPAALVYFFSPNLEHSELHRSLADSFRGVPCVGASMIGGWSDHGPLSQGVTAMSFSTDEVEESTVVFVEGVKADPRGAAKRAASDLAGKLRGKALNPYEYVGIILFDGLCLGEEIVKEFASSTAFPFALVGAAAADELAFERTLVCSKGQVSADGLVVLVMKMKVPFHYGHYVHYEPTDRSFLITAADPNQRVVLEIEGEPAADFYARSLGLRSAAELNNTHFSANPFGVVLGDVVYARSPNSVVDGSGLKFYCYIEAGTRVRLLKRGDLLENGRKALAEASATVGDVGGILLFNCVLRYLEMKEVRSVEPFNTLFSSAPMAGFNTYGEELFTHHNQTLTALFFGKGRSDQ